MAEFLFHGDLRRPAVVRVEAYNEVEARKKAKAGNFEIVDENDERINLLFELEGAEVEMNR